MKPVESDLKPYLRASYFIDCNHHRIKKTAQQLTGFLSEPKMMAKAIFLFVRDEINYNLNSFSTNKEDYQAHTVLAQGEGFCIQKAVLLSALCRAVGIPSRLRLANIRNHQIPDWLAERMKTHIFYCHGYSEIHLDGRWLKATPAFDRFTCERLEINPVNFDGNQDAVFDQHSRDGRLHIEYLKQWGEFPDLPFTEIITTFNDNYGKDMIQQWINAGEQHYD